MIFTDIFHKRTLLRLGKLDEATTCAAEWAQ